MRFNQLFQALGFVAALCICNSAFGQFDRIFENIGREAQGQLGRVIQDAIPYVNPGHGGGHQTLPYPPPVVPPVIRPPVLPPPNCEKPPRVHPLPQPVPNPYPLPHPIPHPIDPNPVPASPAPVPAQTAQPSPTNSTAAIRPELSHELTNTNRGGRQPNLPVVEAGQLVSIDGTGFGNRVGSVQLSFGDMVLTAETVSWNSNNIRAQLPMLPLSQPATAMITIRDATSQIAEQMKVSFAPSTKSTLNNSTISGVQPSAARASTDNNVKVPETQSKSRPNMQAEAKPRVQLASALPQVEVGKMMALKGENFGSRQGTVKLKIGAMSFDTNITSWSGTKATILLPMLELSEPVDGQIRLFNADGSLVSALDVQFANGQKSGEAVVSID